MRELLNRLKAILKFARVNLKAVRRRVRKEYTPQILENIMVQHVLVSFRV